MLIQTKEQIEQNFREDLQALLDKYHADLEADDHYQGYSECGKDIRMMVTIPAVYENNECTHEFTEFNLGRYLWAKPILQ